jgi:ferredoxin
MLTISSSEKLDRFGLTYIVAGIAPNVCSACGTSYMAHEKICVSACPTGTYLYTYKNGGA